MPKTQKRRRKEAKTDYNARLALLKADKPRLVIRKTNRYILTQIIESDTAQDRVTAEASSKELLAKGWPKEKEGSLKSLPAAYLTGFLLVKKLKVKLNEVVFDSGLNRNIAGSRIYAALKGAVDAGLKVPVGEKSLPSSETIEKNEKLKTVFRKVKESL